MSPVSNQGGQHRTAEVIYSETLYTTGTVYSKTGGAWRRGPVAMERVRKLEEENIKNSRYTCRYLHDEPAGGEAAAVYSTHSERDDVTSDGQIWISKSTGLPLRQEFDVIEDFDKQHPDRQHHSVRYDYTNVRPPVP